MLALLCVNVSYKNFLLKEIKREIFRDYLKIKLKTQQVLMMISY